MSVPGYIGMILGTTGLMAIPGWVATYREQGIFRRFRVTPVRRPRFCSPRASWA